MRLLGAVRLSRHRGDIDPSTSPERQRDDVNQWAEANGHTVVRFASDLDVSAIKLGPFERPELGKALAEPAGYDGVIWSTLDRATRSMRDMWRLTEWAADNGKDLVFVHPVAGMHILNVSGAMGRFIVQAMAFAAEMEAESITRRNRETRAFLRNAELWPGGLPPYFMRPVKHGNNWKLEPNPETLPIMREIIERVVRGDSRHSIASDLNGRGVPSPKGLRGKDASWHTKVITGLLENPLLSEVASEDELARVRAVLARRTPHRSTGAGPLSGIAFCGCCGSAMHHQRMTVKRRGRTYDYEYLTCAVARNPVKAKRTCSAAPVRYSVVEDALNELFATTDVGGREVMEAVPVVSIAPEEVEDAKRHLETLISQAGSARTNASRALWASKIEEAEQRLEALEDASQRPSETALRGTGLSYGEVWQYSNRDDARRVLLSAALRVYLAKGDTVTMDVERSAVALAHRDDISVAVSLPPELL